MKRRKERGEERTRRGKGRSGRRVDLMFVCLCWLLFSVCDESSLPFSNRDRHSAQRIIENALDGQHFTQHPGEKREKKRAYPSVATLGNLNDGKGHSSASSRSRLRTLTVLGGRKREENDEEEKKAA